MKVGNELGLSLLWKDEIERKEKGKVNEVVNEDLLAIVQKCTGYEEFIHPQLFEEAFSHPTAMDSMVPSYQRLEWIGDAVACLCVRDWIFHHFESELGLKEMVLLEDAIVSNETFGWLSMKYGLPHLLNHRDPTLPGRIESYMSRLQAGNGLWNSDPPKTISDITESVLGAIHMDKNFKAGQAAALQMLDPVLQVVEEAIKENAIDLLFRFMQHPKRSLQEMAGEVLDLQCFQEAKSASHISDSSYIMLKGLCWNASKDGLFHVAAVKILGSTLVAVASESISISSTTAALLVTQALHDNLPLLQRIKKCQAHLARGSSLTSVMDRQEQHQDYQCQQFLEVHGATKSHTKDGDGGAVVDAMMYQQQEVWGGY
jgi:dsRNA-specific ribonuclease